MGDAKPMSIKVCFDIANPTRGVICGGRRVFFGRDGDFWYTGKLSFVLHWLCTGAWLDNYFRDLFQLTAPVRRFPNDGRRSSLPRRALPVSFCFD